MAKHLLYLMEVELWLLRAEMTNAQHRSANMDLATLTEFANTLQAPIVIFNHEGVVEHTNTAAETLFGINKKTAIGKPFDQFIICPREYAHSVPNYLRDFIEHNEDYWGRPLYATHTDGHRITLDFSLNSYVDKNGDSIDFIIFTEITQAHKSYSEMKSEYEEAKALSTVKTRFLHHIAQEMRMPINNLLNMVGEALDDTGLSSQTATELDAAYHSGRDLQRSFGELTDFLHLEIGDLELQKINFNVRAELESFVDSLNPMARRKNLELATLVSPYVPENLLGDPHRIFQVLQSLLNNAFRYTYEGGISVRAICDIETDTHATLKIEVTDTGSGIPEDKVKAIRKSLVAEGESLAERFQGLGIGLAISKQLMDRMGGKLTVRSTEGLGTTFGMVIELPKASEVSATAGDVRGRNALLVNDSTDDRKRLEEYTDSWGMPHLVAGHGAQALDLMKKSSAENSIDYVIIDLHKKKKAGIKFAKEIRDNDAFQDIKVILLAYDSDGMSPERAEEIGVNAYVNKPFRKEDLYNALTLVSGQDAQQTTLVTNHTMGVVQEQKTQRALLVEDNEVNQIIAKGALKKLGISTDVTNNGEEAIDAIQDKHYDMVLMDCEMPIMDGYEATRLIRDWEKSKGTRIPIIALTADETEECREACKKAGMDEFMKKPFRADQLQLILKNISISH